MKLADVIEEDGSQMKMLVMLREENEGHLTQRKNCSSSIDYINHTFHGDVPLIEAAYPFLY